MIQVNKRIDRYECVDVLFFILRRTLRSGGGREKLGKVLFHYPPESSASDRVGINSLDEARTQEGEFLNDSLVDLYLK